MSAIPVIAEVLDKEPSIAVIWGVFGSMALIGYVLCRYWQWKVGNGLPIIAVLLALILVEEFSSVKILTSGESSSYAVKFYIAVAAAVAAPFVGTIISL